MNTRQRTASNLDKFAGTGEWPGRCMDGRFDDIERFMKLDSEKGSPKVFVRAIFDGQNAGALRSYVRRVMGGRQRVEINVDPLIMDGP